MAPKSIAELKAEAANVFKTSTPAFAYIFQSGVGTASRTGLRIDAPDILKVLTDNMPFGRDPKGKLYYNSLKPNFNSGNKAYYTVTRPEFGSIRNPEFALVVELRREKSEKPYAKFIATLPKRVWENLPDDQFPAFKAGFTGVNQAEWKELDMGSASALLLSYDQSADVTITAQSLHKKLSFKFPDEGGAIESWGYFIFRDSNKLKSGVNYIVDYTNSRVLVFEKQDDKEPVAVFGSYELATDVQAVSVEFQIGPGTRTAEGGRFTDI